MLLRIFEKQDTTRGVESSDRRISFAVDKTELLAKSWGLDESYENRNEWQPTPDDFRFDFKAGIDGTLDKVHVDT